jgi:hypothetical protein
MQRNRGVGGPGAPVTDPTGLRLHVRACLAAAAFAFCCLAPSAALAGPNQYLNGDKILVAHYAQVEGQKLGVTPVPIKVVEVPKVEGQVNGQTVAAYAATGGYDAAGGSTGVETRCVITFAVAAHTSQASRIAGTLANFDAHKAWLLEGAATWVEADLVAQDPYARGAWDDYLDSPGTSLFRRDYDGLGFFGALAQSGTSPWSVFRAMFAAKSDPLAYDASGAPGERFEKLYASAFFGAPELGADWTAYHQGDETADGNVPRTHQVEPTVKLQANEKKTLTVKAYAAGDYRLSTSAPVTTIELAGGYAHLHSTEGPTVDASGFTDLTLCDPSQCRCPGGSVPEDPHPFKLGDLAITGTASGAKVTLTAGCDLPARPCTDLQMTGDFPPPVAGEFAPDGVAEKTISAPNAISATACELTTYAPGAGGYQCSETVDCQPLGAYSLYVFQTVDDAKQGYSYVLNNMNQLYGGSTPADVGDEAAVSHPYAGGYSSAGVVRVENDVFYFLWLPNTPADQAIGATHVLEDAAGQLLN